MSPLQPPVPDSLYGMLLADRDFTINDHVIDARVMQPDGTQALILCWDPGNSHHKLATIIDGKVILVEVPNVIAPARRIVAGHRPQTYSVIGPDGQQSLSYLVGKDAEMSPSASPLPTGSTALRLTETRQRDFTVVAITQLLRKAGLPVGTYKIIAGVMIPNEEVLFDAGGKDESAVKVIKATRSALGVYKNTEYHVHETDTQGNDLIWTICFTDKLLPMSQTLGAFTAFTKKTDGHAALADIVRFLFLDMGHGDVGNVLVTTRPEFTFQAGRITEGARRIVNELSTKLRETDLRDERVDATQSNAAEVVQLIKTGKRIVHGREVDMSELVDRVTTNEAGDMANSMVDTIRGSNAVVYVLGGAIRNAKIRAIIKKKVAAWDVTMCDDDYTSFMNVFGGFFRVYWFTLLSFNKKGR